MCVPTFGYLRLTAYLQLPAAFRSLSRPSSAPNAKAFSICSSSLELLKVFRYFLYILWYTSVLIAWIAVFHTCSEYLSIFWQNCFFTLNRKTWFRFHDIFVFPFTFVCHVCHTNSFELICYKFLFGFQWSPASCGQPCYTASKALDSLKYFWSLITSSWCVLW